MNYLQLVSRLRRKCGMSGASLITLVGQSEDVNRLADWINEAWMAIQLRRADWKWKRASFSFVTVNGQTSYTAVQAGIAAGTFANWHRDSVRTYLTTAGTAGEFPCPYIGYEAWRDAYLFGTQRTVYSQPQVCTITPDKSIAFGPIGASGYTVVGDYFTLASELSVDADTPALPVELHMAIVYRAMMMYATYEAAPEVYQEGVNGFTRMMALAELDQLPEVTIGGTLE